MLNFKLTPATKQILLLCVGMYTLQQINPQITDWLSLYHYKNINFYPFQFATSIFLHSNFSHLFSNMLPIVFFVPYLDELLGDKKVWILFLFTGIGASLLFSVCYHFDLLNIVSYNSYELSKEEIWDDINHSPSKMLGASGAVFGILMAMAIYFPKKQIQLFFIPFKIPINIIVLLYLVYEFNAGVQRVQGDNIAHFAHFGGALFALSIIQFWRKYSV